MSAYLRTTLGLHLTLHASILWASALVVEEAQRDYLENLELSEDVKVWREHWSIERHACEERIREMLATRRDETGAELEPPTTCPRSATIVGLDTRTLSEWTV